MSPLSGYLHGKQKLWKYVMRKIPKNGYPFQPKWPLKMGRGFEAWAAHPSPDQIWVALPQTKYTIQLSLNVFC